MPIWEKFLNLTEKAGLSTDPKEAAGRRVMLTPGGPIYSPPQPKTPKYAFEQPKPAAPPTLPKSSIIDKAQDLFKEQTPAWATQTELPKTFHASQQGDPFQVAQNVVADMNSGKISANSALVKLQNAGIPKGGPYGMIWGAVQNAIAAEQKAFAAPAPAPAPGVQSVPSGPMQSTPPGGVPKFEIAGKPLPVFDGLQKVGDQLGSNPGGTYVDAGGREWYIKQTQPPKKGVYYVPNTNEYALSLIKNEKLANSLYKLAGVKVPDLQIGMLNGKPAIASRKIDLQPHPDQIDKVKPYLQQDFAVDAWLANWDVAGLTMDNIIFDPKNPQNFYRIDQGGALMYRAQGTPKKSSGLPITSDVEEIWTLRGLPNPSITPARATGLPFNSPAADIFRSMTEGQLMASAHRLEAVTPEKIYEALKKYGPDNDIARNNLLKLLLRRRANIIQQLDPAATPEKELREFRKKLFNDPEYMKLYHGSGSGEFEGVGLKIGPEGGFWATPDYDLAKMYTGSTKKGIHDFIAKTSDFLRFDAKGETYATVNSKVLQQARDGFYPGIIIDNIYDAPGGRHAGPPKTVVITLDPVATRRSGAAFDPAKASINDLLASGAAIAVPSAIAAAMGGISSDRAEASPLDRIPGKAVGKGVGAASGMIAGKGVGKLTGTSPDVGAMVGQAIGKGMGKAGGKEFGGIPSMQHLKGVFDRDLGKPIPVNPQQVLKAGDLGKSGFRITADDLDESGNHNYFIRDTKGDSVGHIELTARGKTLYVNYISAYGKGANALGKQAMIDVIKQLKSIYPTATRIQGYRVSGAREQTKKQGMASMSLKEIVALIGTSAAAELGISTDDQAEAGPLGGGKIPEAGKLVSGMFDKLEAGPRNQFFSTPDGIEWYLRLSKGFSGPGKTLMVATVQVKEGEGTPGKTNFIDTFKKIEAEAKQRGYESVYAEQVMNPKLRNWLEKNGYVEEPGSAMWSMGDGTASYIKKLGVAGAAVGGSALLEQRDAEAREGKREPLGASVSREATEGGAKFGESSPGYGSETGTQFFEGLGTAAVGVGDILGKRDPGQPFETLQGLSDDQRKKLQGSLRTIIGKKPGEDLTDSERRTWQIISGAVTAAMGTAQAGMAPLTAAAKKVMDYLYPNASEDDKRTLAMFVASTLPIGAKEAIGGARAVGAHPAVREFMRDTGGSMVTPGSGPPGGGPKAPSTFNLLRTNASKAMRGFLSPATVGPQAAATAGIIRKHIGISARFEELTRSALGDDPTKSWVQNLTQNYERRINDLPESEQLGLISYIEGRSMDVKMPSSLAGDPAFQGIADEIRHSMRDRRNRLGNLSRHDKMSFITEYISHFWDDPQKAKQFQAWWETQGPAGTSAKGHTKARAIPTIADGISYGLKPVTTNPIDISLRYVEQMDRYIAHMEILDEMGDQGMLKWMPEGSPQIPDGWAPIRGKWATRGELNGVAPKEAARVYNRFASLGFQGEFLLPAINAVQRTFNAITGLELGLAGFHATTETTEAVMSNGAIAAGQALAIPGKIARGQLIEALKLLGGAAKRTTEAVGLPTAGATLGYAFGGPVGGVAGMLLSGGVLRAARGSKLRDVYLGRSPASATPAMRHVVNLVTASGGRMTGKKHTLREYEFSPMGSFFTQWKRMGLKGMGKDMMRRLNRPRYISGHPVGTPRYAYNASVELFTQLGNIFETVSQPLFEYYIPRLKDGAIYDNVHAWLEANPHASIDEQLAATRKITDSIDNRFGEMIQDNIFWNKGAKQLAMLAMRSYSWNMGTVREIGGGALQMVRGRVMRGAITSKDYDPRIGYVIALPVLTGLMGMAYTYLKAGDKNVGDGPADFVKHLAKAWAPATGGKTPGPGGRGTFPELAMLPGYMRDVLGWMNDWGQEIANKVATGPRLAAEMWTGKDWRGDPIVQHLNPTIQERVGDWLSYMFFGNDPQLGPITVRNLNKGMKRGSNISVLEQLMGIRPASMYLTAPEQTRRAQEHREKTEIKRAQRYQRKRERQFAPDTAPEGAPSYEGPME